MFVRIIWLCCCKRGRDERLLTFQIIRIVDVNLLVELECHLIVAHSTKAACYHKAPFHLRKPTRTRGRRGWVKVLLP